MLSTTIYWGIKLWFVYNTHLNKMFKSNVFEAEQKDDGWYRNHDLNVSRADGVGLGRLPPPPPTIITPAYPHFPFSRLKYLSLFLEINSQRLLCRSVFITRCRNTSRIKFYGRANQFYAFLLETSVIYLERKMKQLRGKSKLGFLLHFSFVLKCVVIVFKR